jgi:hypothetical protein
MTRWADKLAGLFHDSFKTYESRISQEIKAAGPVQGIVAARHA